MAHTLEDFRKQAKKYADELDLERVMNAIDFSKVDTNKLKSIDFSRGFESARAQLEQLPKVRLTTQPQQVIVQEENDSGFLPGLLLGVVLGAILALIFAPKSGSETRETIVSTVEDIKDKVTGQAEPESDGLPEDPEVESDFSSEEPAIERNFGQTL